MSRDLTLSKMLLAALLAATTAALAYVRVPLPFTPVPITGQTLGVMLSGGLLGPWIGLLSQALYLLLGAIGLPVFAGGHGGLGVLFGPTGGYLWSYPLAAALTGWFLKGREPSWWNIFGGVVLGGIGAIYLLGVLQLALVTGMGLGKAILAGALPFLPGDFLKAGVAATVIRRVNRMGVLHL